MADIAAARARARSRRHHAFIHGHSTTYQRKTPTLNAWKNMVQSCLTPSSHAYESHGGRGIKVAERWLVFKNFLDDMGVKPDECWLVRHDNDGDFEPGNCSWGKPQEVHKHRRVYRLRAKPLPQTTHCGNGHPWTEENTYITPTGGRQCRACRRELSRAASKRYRERKAAA